MELGGYETDWVTRISTNLDDLSPEITGAVMDKLFAVGHWMCGLRRFR